jgi:phosphinothricin acetyltransferase
LDAAAVIRPARESDVESLTDLYNHYIEHSPATFDITPKSLEERRQWMAHYSDSGPYRLLVAERSGQVCGYASSSPFRPKAAYATTVEVTVYVGHDSLGVGIGRALYGALFSALAGQDLHRALAGITLPNTASETLHRSFGFESVATFDEVGRKFERYWSVRWFEKALS